LYKRLKEVIETIRIIDDHGHPGFTKFFESVPENHRIPFAVDPFKTPEETACGFPYLTELHYEAYEKFYGFSKDDIKNLDKREEIKKEYEEKRRDISSWIDQLLDDSGVDILMANIAIPKSLQGNPRIRFVPSVDCLVFPFDNAEEKKRLISRYFIGFFEYDLKELKNQYKYFEMGIEGYLQFIDQVLAGYRAQNVAAFKFVIAYARNTYFEKIDPQQVPSLYQAAHAGDHDAYRKLQDFLVWYILRNITANNNAIQFHFALTDNYVNYFDPLNLANLLEDEQLKDAKIVLLHGGYPRYQNAEVLALGGLTPNNVCIDISGRIMFANHPRIIAKMVREWLEKPVLWNKIIYGSDVLWGERYIYTCARTGRDAIYFALEGMIDEKIIDEDTAIMIAKNIFRENALRIYHLN